MSQTKAAAAEDQRVLTPAPGQDAPDSGSEPEDCENPDETAEVEHEGRTYQVPKPLKGALMRQADYTRKTQELAQARRQTAAAQQHLAQHAHVQLLGLARLHALDLALAPARQINWPAFAAQDPVRAQLVRQHFQRLKAMRDQSARAIQNMQQQRTLDAQRGRVRQVEDGHAKLKTDIEGWSPELQRRIVAAGKANEFSDSELHAVTDPRMIKVLNKARQFDETQAKNAAAKRLTAAQAAKPVNEVGDKSPATNDPARMSTAEWMRWRAGQLRKRH